MYIYEAYYIDVANRPQRGKAYKQASSTGMYIIQPTNPAPNPQKTYPHSKQVIHSFTDKYI